MWKFHWIIILLILLLNNAHLCSTDSSVNSTTSSINYYHQFNVFESLIKKLVDQTIPPRRIKRSNVDNSTFLAFQNFTSYVSKVQADFGILRKNFEKINDDVQKLSEFGKLLKPNFPKSELNRFEQLKSVGVGKANQSGTLLDTSQEQNSDLDTQITEKAEFATPAISPEFQGTTDQQILSNLTQHGQNNYSPTAESQLENLSLSKRTTLQIPDTTRINELQKAETILASKIDTTNESRPTFVTTGFQSENSITEYTTFKSIDEKFISSTVQQNVIQNISLREFFNDENADWSTRISQSNNEKNLKEASKSPTTPLPSTNSDIPYFTETFQSIPIGEIYVNNSNLSIIDDLFQTEINLNTLSPITEDSFVPTINNLNLSEKVTFTEPKVEIARSLSESSVTSPSVQTRTADIIPTFSNTTMKNKVDFPQISRTSEMVHIVNDTAPYKWKRVCFQNIIYIGNLAAQHKIEPADMYIYYYIPSEEQELAQAPHQEKNTDTYNCSTGYHMQYEPQYPYLRHRPYSKNCVPDKAVHKVGESDHGLYGAYSLNNHKLVSQYQSSTPKSVTPTRRRKESPSKVSPKISKHDDIFCTNVPVYYNRTTQRSSVINEAYTAIEEDQKLRKFYYKKQEMPFEHYLSPSGVLISEECDQNSKPCLDRSACIPLRHWCDGIVQCRDLSDEKKCTCRERMDANKICDGYFDCPNGEDEDGCFGCPKKTFSCGDWSKWIRNSSCVSMFQRCDNKIDCANGYDEENCEILTDTVNSHDQFVSSYTNGYLHRNWKGKWYPACEYRYDNYEWAMKACTWEIGSHKSHVEVEMLPFVNKYDGKFISETETGQIVFLDECRAKNLAVHVKCPPIPCGTRIEQEYFNPAYRSRRSTYSGSNQSSIPADKKLKILVDAVRYISLRNKLNKTTSSANEDEQRVVGGKFSSPGKWPWVVAVLKNGNFHCGGVILDETWIMTAAHCVYRYEQHYFEVQAGILRRFSFSPNGQIRAVTQIIIHPSYVNSDMQNDLALIRLESALKFNRWVRPACLPEARPPWGPTPGTVCTAIGWGSTNEHGPNPDNVKEIDLPVLARCKHLPDKQSNEICAGYTKGGFDTCQGDSGGPLLCRIPQSYDRYYVAGIVSHGEGCARPSEPGAYTRVALYIPWLMQNTDDDILKSSRRPKKDCPGLRCAQGGKCVALKNICDGVIDCLNAEDETGCIPFSDLGDGNDIDFCDKQSVYRSYSLHDYKYKHASKCRLADNNSSRSRSNNGDDQNVDFQPIFYNSTIHFLCNKVIQVIPQSWRCNGEIDCDDATDEMNCTCLDFLKTYNKSLICDGIVHCHDSSDENDCLERPCQESEFTCYKSHSCVNIISLCNGTRECLNGEDEDKCYAVVPLSKAGQKSFDIAEFSERGIVVALNGEGIWKPFCVENENEFIYDTTVAKIIHRLGFKKTNGSYEKIQVINGDIQRPNYDIHYCVGVHVDFRYAMHDDDEITVPWHVDIYINGQERCFGFLVDDQWIIADDACCQTYNASQDTVVTLMGGDQKSKIRSLYQQLIAADQVTCSTNFKIMVIHLSQPPEITLHTRVLHMLTWLPPQTENDYCILIFNYGISSNSVQVKSQLNNCRRNKRCYTVTSKQEICKNSGALLLEGVVCQRKKKSEWYLSTTVIGENDNFCMSETDVLQLDSIENAKSIFVHHNESLQEQVSSYNRGYRCDYGNWIPWSAVCDEKPDCRNGEDENHMNCLLKTDICRNDTTIDCGCKSSEFKCRSGKCVSKAFICDGEKDCEDSSDEPANCESAACAVYLNLTNPSKLCDLRQDCFDKTDEDDLCPINCDPLLSFNCSESNKCIPKDFVCDGERDCPLGEDEQDCVQLRPYSANMKDVIVWVRSNGKWQELCMNEEYIDLEEEKLCQQLGFQKLLKRRHILSHRLIDSESYTTIRLNKGKDIKIKIRRQRNSNATEDCTYLNLICE